MLKLKKVANNRGRWRGIVDGLCPTRGSRPRGNHISQQALRHQKNRGGLKKFCCKDGTTSSCKVSETELGFGGRSETPVLGRKSF